MSESILRALMQLFALVAKIDSISNDGRSVVRLFLKQQVSADLVQDYLNIFEEYLGLYQKISTEKDGKARKRTSVNSVKVLRICTQINEELKQNQKAVVLIRLLEFLQAGEFEEQELEFAETVASTFNIQDEEFKLALRFIAESKEEIPDHENCLYIGNKKNNFTHSKEIINENINGLVKILKLDQMGLYLALPHTKEALYINGQAMANGRVYFLTHGSSLRSTKVNPIYFSDITSKFRNEESHQEINFHINKLSYKFPAGNVGIHPLSIHEQSGNLVGIMGASGAGKSTFLSLLNGSLTPSSGSVTINGIDIHQDSKALEGIIGHISQDDLLMEDLTVFQNLYYNAKLCYDKQSEAFIVKKTLDLLKSIGLYETKDLKVGSPLEKTISGGQRKRLNIALELIREPQVLFVDEPTSGLSSRDSENIMDLLKELALKGKLVFVVIHQPSSDIFKLFDTLLILDTGGYTIYYGNPVDAVIYFKQMINHVNANESECFHCGNVNPEQIFNIIETKVVDEFGNVTDKRKIPPKTWANYYLENFNHDISSSVSNKAPKGSYKTPRFISQFKVFFTRDILSKLANQQYMLINFLEGPFLAFILSFMVKYFSVNDGKSTQYLFKYNENLTAYLFISVVVALFMGLTVSAEEIIKDRKILKRESFLNLSWLGYLHSKIAILFIISAIQTLSYVILGNLVLGIKGMYMEYWMILFASSCFANMLGLNISSAFNSVITIYIIIPILLIPQLLLSGVIVKFDKLHPTLSSQTVVPFSGEVMTSRWAFEALAVTQFRDNAFEKHFYQLDKLINTAEFKKDYWRAEVESRFNTCNIYHTDPTFQAVVQKDWLLIQNEILEELLENPNISFPCDVTTFKNAKQYDESFDYCIKQYLFLIKEYYTEQKNNSIRIKNKMISAIQKGNDGKAVYQQLVNTYQNDNLSDLVTNKKTDVRIAEYNNDLIQKIYPVYLDGKGFRAHFFAPTKKLFGKTIDTFWVNLLVIWGYTGVLFITLYYELLKKIITFFGRLPILFKK